MVAMPQPNIYEYKITIDTDKIFNIYGNGDSRTDASSNPLITSGLNGLVLIQIQVIQ